MTFTLFKCPVAFIGTQSMPLCGTISAGHKSTKRCTAVACTRTKGRCLSKVWGQEIDYEWLRNQYKYIYACMYKCILFVKKIHLLSPTVQNRDWFWDSEYAGLTFAPVEGDFIDPTADDCDVHTHAQDCWSQGPGGPRWRWAEPSLCAQTAAVRATVTALAWKTGILHSNVIILPSGTGGRHWRHLVYAETCWTLT